MWVPAAPAGVTWLANVGCKQHRVGCWEGVCVLCVCVPVAEASYVRLTLVMWVRVRCACWQERMISLALTGLGNDEEARRGDMIDSAVANAVTEDLVHDPSAYLYKGLKFDYSDEDWINLHRHAPHLLPRAWTCLLAPRPPPPM